MFIHPDFKPCLEILPEETPSDYGYMLMRFPSDIPTIDPGIFTALLAQTLKKLTSVPFEKPLFSDTLSPEMLLVSECPHKYFGHPLVAVYMKVEKVGTLPKHTEIALRLDEDDLIFAEDTNFLGYFSRHKALMDAVDFQSVSDLETVRPLSIPTLQTVVMAVFSILLDAKARAGHPNTLKRACFSVGPDTPFLECVAPGHLRRTHYPNPSSMGMCMASRRRVVTRSK